MTTTNRTLNDLARGDNAHAIDVLRLALHYLLRGGWHPYQPDPPGTPAQRIGTASRAMSIEQAISRARNDLSAVWMRGVEATEAIRIGIGATRANVAAISRWERDPARTAEDVKAVFVDVIRAMAAEQKGLILDVAV